jgi:hypothetical protein
MCSTEPRAAEKQKVNCEDSGAINRQPLTGLGVNAATIQNKKSKTATSSMRSPQE